MTDWNRYRGLMTARLDARTLRGEDIRCPVCAAGIAKPCDDTGPHSARIAAAIATDPATYAAAEDRTAREDFTR